MSKVGRYVHFAAREGLRDAPVGDLPGAAHADADRRGRMAERCLTCSRSGCRSFDMAWRQETWPV